MTKTDIIKRLEKIVSSLGGDVNDLLTSKKSNKHADKAEVLLDHLAILIKYMALDTEAYRREIFAFKKALEK